MTLFDMLDELASEGGISKTTTQMQNLSSGYFNQSGAMLAGGLGLNSAQSNVFGGHNIYNDVGTFQGHTTSNVFGGETLYDAAGTYLGHTM